MWYELHAAMGKKENYRLSSLIGDEICKHRMAWNFYLRMLKIWNSGYPNFNCIKLGAKLHPVSQHFIRIATKLRCLCFFVKLPGNILLESRVLPYNYKGEKDFNYWFITNTIKTRPIEKLIHGQTLLSFSTFSFTWLLSLGVILLQNWLQGFLCLLSNSSWHLFLFWFINKRFVNFRSSSLLCWSVRLLFWPKLSSVAPHIETWQSPPLWLNRAVMLSGTGNGRCPRIYYPSTRRVGSTS